MANKTLKSLNFGGADNYFPLPLVTAADNDKILSVVNGEWVATEAPSGGPSSGQYVWSKQYAGSTATEDTTGGTYTLTTANTSRPSSEIEYSASAPTYNAETKKWEMSGSTIVTLTNADTTVPSFSGNMYVRLTSAPNVWYLATAINTGGSGPYIKSLAYDAMYTADVDSSYVEYVTGETESDYPDGGWSDGVYYKLFTASFVAVGISDFVQTNTGLGTFHSVHYGNGIWVACAFYTVYGLYYSTDGITWNQSNITSGQFDFAYYGDGIWVAGGNNGDFGLYYSTDGMTWTQSNQTSGGFGHAYYNNGLWISSKTSGGLYYSTDGITWNQSNINSGSFRTTLNVSNLFVTGASTKNGLYYSTDGITWTQSNITNIFINSIYYGNGIWVAASSDNGLYYSTDGMTWTQSNQTSGTFYSVYYADGIWFASYGWSLYYSKDGMTWTESSSATGGASSSVFNKLYYAAGIWIVVGTGIYYSTDGDNWVQSNITTGKFESLHYGNGTFVALGDKTAGICCCSILNVRIKLING